MDNLSRKPRNKSMETKSFAYYKQLLERNGFDVQIIPSPDFYCYYIGVQLFRNGVDYGYWFTLKDAYDVFCKES